MELLEEETFSGFLVISWQPENPKLPPLQFLHVLVVKKMVIFFDIRRGIPSVIGNLSWI
jgi:hypothetical protein